MTTNTLICYPKCTTCRKAEKWLKENNIPYQYRPIDQENPTADELKEWISKSELPIQRWFNTSGKLYRENNMKEKVKTLSHTALIDILATNGMMVKRPILITQQRILIGFKETEWNLLFDK